MRIYEDYTFTKSLFYLKSTAHLIAFSGNDPPVSLALSALKGFFINHINKALTLQILCNFLQTFGLKGSLDPWVNRVMALGRTPYRTILAYSDLKLSSTKFASSCKVYSLVYSITAAQA